MACCVAAARLMIVWSLFAACQVESGVESHYLAWSGLDVMKMMSTAAGCGFSGYRESEFLVFDRQDPVDTQYKSLSGASVSFQLRRKGS
jgi:hypothetical protein